MSDIGIELAVVFYAAGIKALAERAEKAEAERDELRDTREGRPMGIDDISNGRCNAAVSIAGEHFRCELAASHAGWAHQSVSAEAIWRGHEDQESDQ